MITVQPIRYTSKPDEWHQFAQSLGLTPPFPPNSAWAEFDGRGILAIHQTHSPELAGTTDFHVLSDDVDAVESRLEDCGFAVARTMLDDIGPLLTVTAGSGATISVSSGARETKSGELTVQPVWYQADLEEPRRILESLGLNARLASNSGNWIECEADGGGSAALHRATSPRIDLSLQFTGDLDALAQKLVDSGFVASVVDEAYNRTIRARTPDGGELWINGEQKDLYGYTRLAQS